MFRTYDCPVEGCEYDAVAIQDVARHLEEEHGADDRTPDESSAADADEP